MVAEVLRRLEVDSITLTVVAPCVRRWDGNSAVANRMYKGRENERLRAELIFSNIVVGMIRRRPPRPSRRPVDLRDRA
jgi:hypothetical protein